MIIRRWLTLLGIAALGSILSLSTNRSYAEEQKPTAPAPESQPVAHIINFSAHPRCFEFNWTKPVKLQWTTQFALSCYLQWTAKNRNKLWEVQRNGHQEVTQLAEGDNLFKLSCSGPYGTAERDVHVLTGWDGPPC